MYPVKYLDHFPSPPYFSSNSGSVYVYKNFTSQSDTSDNLNFGNRDAEHTTQWISLTLSDLINVLDFGSGTQNNVVNGKVTYDLFGVNQRVFLNYRINPPSNASNGLRILTITPSLSASFYCTMWHQQLLTRVVQ